MRRVSHESNANLFAVRVSTFVSCSKMVLGITSSLKAITEGLFRSLVVSLSHKHLSRLANDISESVQTASMSHSHNESFSTELSESINTELKSRTEGPVSLEIEPLHGVKFLSQEISPSVRPVKTLKHVNLLINRKVGKLNRLKLLSDPLLGISVAHVHEFDSNLFAVSVLEDFD